MLKQNDRDFQKEELLAYSHKIQITTHLGFRGLKKGSKVETER